MSDWTKAPALPSLEWEHIQTQALLTNSAAIAFSGLDTTYRRFILHLYAISQGTAAAGINLRLNNDGAGNYESQTTDLYMNSGAAVTPNPLRLVGTGFFVVSVTDIGGRESGAWVVIQKPAAAMNARITARSVGRRAGFQLYGSAMDGEWVNTGNLINRIDIIGRFGAGTRMMLSGGRESL